MIPLEKFNVRFYHWKAVLNTGRLLKPAVCYSAITGCKKTAIAQSESNIQPSSSPLDATPAGKACGWEYRPQILTLQLKRFQLDYLRNRYEKITCCIDVPQKLHIKVHTHAVISNRANNTFLF